MIRTFIAFDVEEKAKSLIYQLIEKGKQSYPQRINWTAKNNIHFTFQFIGDTHEKDITPISEQLEQLAVQTQSFMLNEAKLEWYPFNQSPLICLMYQYHHPFLQKQHRLFKDVLADLNYEVDQRRLNFHLTLARIKADQIPNQRVWDEALLNEIKQIKINKISLYKSTLKPSGAVYDCLAGFSLKEV